MTDYAISQTHVQDVPSFDSLGNPIVYKRVTYMVGRQGPFTLTYQPGQYSPEKVAADMQAEVDTLKALYDAQPRAGS